MLASRFPSVMILERVVAWAEEREDIVAAVLTGSSARGGGAMDEFSDLDLELFTTDPGQYAGVGWLDAFGEVMVCLPFDDGEWTTRLVFFEGGAKVDFQVRPAGHLDELTCDPKAGGTWSRGFRFLVDKAGVAPRVVPASIPAPLSEPLFETAFDATVREFWFEAAHIPRYLLRDELWVVKFRDWTMKSDLLKMIEWHARAHDGDDLDVWYIGTKMKEWAGDDVWAALHQAFGRFDRADGWRALLATTALFDRLSKQVADAHGFARPDAGDRVTAYIRSFAPRFV